VKILAALLTLAVSGCAILQQLEGGGSGGTSTTPAATGGAATAAQGTDCGTDPDTSAVLCLGSTVCPGLTIDSSLFPGCGYRVNGVALDIECSCSGWLCPLGAASCSAAQSAMTQENYSVVCSQLGTAACVQGTPVAASSSSSSGGTCDTTCRSECAGEPTCIQLCGC
jgi:hypothetical protein